MVPLLKGNPGNKNALKCPHDMSDTNFCTLKLIFCIADLKSGLCHMF